MAEKNQSTRLLVIKFPADVAEELKVLSEFNAVGKTEFLVTALEQMMEYLEGRFPALAELPPVPLRTRQRAAHRDDLEDEEPVLMAAEDEE